MPFIPPGEKAIETKTCRFSGQKFVITDRDTYLLDKISPVFDGKKYSLPTPDLSPEMRYLNRLTWRNERTFFHRKCSMTGGDIISIHHADVPFPVYNQRTWWSDDWNSMEYGRDFDFDRPFFEQCKELYDVVPQIALNTPRSENSEFTNQSQDLKDCYLSFCSNESRSCFFGMWNNLSQDCSDCSYINYCNNCYELLGATKCTHCYFSQNLENCTDVEYSRDCQGCQKCFGCINLKNVSYRIFNQEVSAHEYEIQAEQLRNDPKLQEKLQIFFHNHPRKFYHGHTNENSCGDYLLNNKDTLYCFNSRENEFLRYSQDASHERFCTDLTETIFQNFCTHVEGSMNNSNCGFCMKMLDAADAWYCSHMYGVHRAFGCIGLKQKENCIFNKAYSEHEWQKLAGRIALHMQSTGEWGRHFPPELSPFALNVSMAGEYFPMTETQVEKFGWKWKTQAKSGAPDVVYNPLPIQQYDERIVGLTIAKKNIDACLGAVLVCNKTGKPYRIISQELAFYIQNGIQIPHVESGMRYKERMALRNPRKLWERKCDNCSKQLLSTYAAERGEKVLCEKCYREEVY